MLRILGQGVAAAWRCGATFSDLEIHCGADGGIVKSHRLILASISPFLKHALLDSCRHEDEAVAALILPEVGSECVRQFLDSLLHWCLGKPGEGPCPGCRGEARISPELSHLGISIDGPLSETVGRPGDDDLLLSNCVEPMGEFNSRGQGGERQADELGSTRDPDGDQEDDIDVVDEVAAADGEEDLGFFKVEATEIAICDQNRPAEAMMSKKLEAKRRPERSPKIVATFRLAKGTRKMGKRSPAWYFFTVVQNADDLKVKRSKSKRDPSSLSWCKCSICGAAVGTLCGSTSLLIGHLQTCHQGVLDRCQEQLRRAQSQEGVGTIIRKGRVVKKTQIFQGSGGILPRRVYPLEPEIAAFVDSLMPGNLAGSGFG